MMYCNMCQLSGKHPANYKGSKVQKEMQVEMLSKLRNKQVEQITKNMLPIPGIKGNNIYNDLKEPKSKTHAYNNTQKMCKDKSKRKYLS